MAGRSNPRRARRKRPGGPSAATVIGLLVCVVCFSAAFFLWKAALFGAGRNESGEEPFRPVVGDPPYRVCIDAGHGGSDPGARGVVEEKEMTAQTSEALLALLEADPNYIPLRSRESYDATAKPSERAEAINAQSPQLLLSIHGNSAPEGSAAAGFECYPSVPGRTWHQESYYFAQQLAQGMQAAGAKLRGHGGIRYIYYQGEVKQLVESTHTEVRDERSFTLWGQVKEGSQMALFSFISLSMQLPFSCSRTSPYATLHNLPAIWCKSGVVVGVVDFRPKCPVCRSDLQRNGLWLPWWLLRKSPS